MNKCVRKPRGNHEWTIQRHRQQCAYKTQDEDKQNTTLKTKKMSNTYPPNTKSEPRCL